MKNKKWIVVAVCLLLVGLLFYWYYYRPYCSTIIYHGDYPNPVIVTMQGAEGQTYTIEAVEGQVCVWFEDGVSIYESRQQIKYAGGKVIAQVPEWGYFLVEVPADDLMNFIGRMEYVSGVRHAYPNMLFDECEASTYVLDNFYPQLGQRDTTSHGTKVQYALQESESQASFKAFNIGYKNSKKICTDDKKSSVCLNTEYFALKEIADENTDGPIFINMSYGPSLPKRVDKQGNEVHYYWSDTATTYEEKRTYQERYLQFIKNKINNLKPLLDKDFVVLLSAGNEGVKDFDRAIVSYLRKHLQPEEIAIMEKHFMIVTADETNRVREHSEKAKEYDNMRWRNPDMASYYTNLKEDEKHLAQWSLQYSNEMERGRFDPWVTRVDISDFKYHGEETRGTSFASPRATYMLSSVANENNLTAAEVLALAKTVSSQNRNLTKEALQQAAEEYKSNQASDDYSRFGALLYRLVPDDAKGLEVLEMKNTASESIHVKGTLLNTIASHGGDNVMDVDVVIEGGKTVFVDGFIENRCTITDVSTVQSSEEQSLTPAVIPSKEWKSKSSQETPSQNLSSSDALNEALDNAPSGATATDGSSPEQAARRLGIAIALRDASTIRSLTERDLYEEIMEMRGLVQVLMISSNRQKAASMYGSAPVKVIPNKSNNNKAVVRFYPNGRRIDYYMRYSDGAWRAYDYAHGGMHTPKSMRRPKR